MGSLRQHVQTGASVVESAMSRVGSGTAGAGLLADRGDAESRLRRTVAAGPGGAVEVGDTVLGGVLRSVADEVVITAGLAVAGHVDRRSRVLTGVVVVAAVLGLCLFRRENYDLVLARVLAGSPRRVIDGGPPTGQALSTARTRLAPQAMRTVFEQAAACMPPAGPGGSSPPGWAAQASASSTWSTNSLTRCCRAPSTSPIGISFPWPGGYGAPRPERTWPGGSRTARRACPPGSYGCCPTAQRCSGSTSPTRCSPPGGPRPATVTCRACPTSPPASSSSPWPSPTRPDAPGPPGSAS